MDLSKLFLWLENLPYSTAIREGGMWFPGIETVHVLALTLVVGSITMVDLRLLGLASRDRAVTEVTKQVLPWTWSAFLVAAVTGFLLFSSAAVKYWGMNIFRAKMVLLMLAGGNMVLFHFLTYRSVNSWDVQRITPLAARLAGALSLTFWIGVVFLGRWMGFV